MSSAFPQLIRGLRNHLLSVNATERAKVQEHVRGSTQSGLNAAVAKSAELGMSGTGIELYTDAENFFLERVLPCPEDEAAWEDYIERMYEADRV